MATNYIITIEGSTTKTNNREEAIKLFAEATNNGIHATFDKVKTIETKEDDKMNTYIVTIDNNRIVTTNREEAIRLFAEATTNGLPATFNKVETVETNEESNKSNRLCSQYIEDYMNMTIEEYCQPDYSYWWF